MLNEKFEKVFDTLILLSLITKNEDEYEAYMNIFQDLCENDSYRTKEGFFNYISTYILKNTKELNNLGNQMMKYNESSHTYYMYETLHSYLSGIYEATVNTLMELYKYIIED